MTSLLLRLLPAIVILAATQAFAERLDVTLDIDHDGKPDHAALDYDPVAGVGDLSIWLDAGNGALEPSRQHES